MNNSAIHFTYGNNNLNSHESLNGSFYKNQNFTTIYDK